MSKYKGKHGGKKGQNFGQGSPPPLFGQCPKENIFFSGGLPVDRAILKVEGRDLQLGANNTAPAIQRNSCSFFLACSYEMFVRTNPCP